jgi:hypothetical protein
MSAFVIEKDGEIKETFSYQIPFNKTTQQSLVAYSHANYGPDAVFRDMTDEEKADFKAPIQDQLSAGAAISEGTYRTLL